MDVRGTLDVSSDGALKHNKSFDRGNNRVDQHVYEDLSQILGLTRNGSKGPSVTSVFASQQGCLLELQNESYTEKLCRGLKECNDAEHMHRKTLSELNSDLQNEIQSSGSTIYLSENTDNGLGLPSEAPACKVKILCSSGGKILPRPSDRTLRYVGGDTHLISIHKDVSWGELVKRTSAICKQAHEVKYQLPGTELDALISVSSDEDLKNMMEEYLGLERTEDSPRLRIFLIPLVELQNASSFLVDSTQLDNPDYQYIIAINGMVDLSPKKSSAENQCSESDTGTNLDQDPSYKRPSSVSLLPSEILVDSDTSHPVHISQGQQHCVLPVSPSPFQAEDSNGSHSQINGIESHAESCDSLTAALLSPDISSSDVTCSRPYQQGTIDLMNVLQKMQTCTSQSQEFDGMQLNCSDHNADFVRPLIAQSGVGKNRKMEDFSEKLVYNQRTSNFTMPGFHIEEPISLPSESTNHCDTRQGIPYSYSDSKLEEHEKRSAYFQQEGTSPSSPLNFSKSQIDLSDLKVQSVALDICLTGPLITQPHSSCVPPSNSFAGDKTISHSALISDYKHQDIAGISPQVESMEALVVKCNQASRVQVTDPSQDRRGQDMLVPVSSQADFSSSTGHNDIEKTSSVFYDRITGKAPCTSTLTEGIDASWTWNSEVEGLVSNTTCEIKNTNYLVDLLSGTPYVSVFSEPKTLQLLTDQKDVDFLKHTPKSSANSYALEIENRSGQGSNSNRNDVYSDPQKLIIDPRFNRELSLIDSDILPSFGGKHDIQGGGDDTRKFNKDHADTARQLLLKSPAVPENIISSIPLVVIAPSAFPESLDLTSKSEIPSEAVPGFEVTGSEIISHNTSELHKIHDPESEDLKSADQGRDESVDDAIVAEMEANIYGLQIIKDSDLEELKELGSGTYGTVYHGKWRGSDVAIKRIRKSYFAGRSSEQDRLAQDFWREAHILSRLHHPNVVAFYGVVPDGAGGTLATVTEFMVNGSLRRALQRKDKYVDHRKKLIIAMDAAFGMEYLHSRNIVHFDLKCDNLLVNLSDPHRPICKVGDFGLSRIKRNTLVSGGVRGTLPWMAPELLNGNSSRVSEKVDVFSFGISMWEILTGDEPYADMHYGAIIGGIVKNTLRPEIPGDCDPEWKKLMEDCWSTEPECRPSFTGITNRLRNMSHALRTKPQRSSHNEGS
ncbi:PREDICTED: uncharacterized protein LOC104818945 [Tarenaya hassleriana]|uniref:uncharacterized protein LOC104818945 n=1 Tax=Tarenaya hassleriana TaxID=28532 RepID=UPI00053CA3A2|nr:PREDICTED: uncharacterized protein LOC104818945 [Tarenaya hassleriana]XP_010547055.1 PREDICTED: uncharacterized protein LOC104818945 [Tarenaya hassleriana]